MTSRYLSVFKLEIGTDLVIESPQEVLPFSPGFLGLNEILRKVFDVSN